MTSPWPALASGKTHVWMVRLDLNDTEIPGLTALLTRDEQDRARRFRLPRDQRRSIASRAALRLILGAYTGKVPEEVRITVGKRGKPRLAEAPAPLSFNMSHSHELAAVAITMERRVGIDLEMTRPVPHAARIARRAFSPVEARAVEGAAPEEQLAVFFRAWTAREAFLKAIGTGFSSALPPIEIPPGDGVSPIAAHIPDADQRLVRWSFYPLEPAVGYISTVAIEGDASPPDLFTLSLELRCPV